MIDSVLAIMFQASRRALLQHFLHMSDLMRCVAYADRAILPSDEAVPLKVTIVPPKLYLPANYITPPRPCCPAGKNASASGSLFFFCRPHTAATLQSQARFLPALAHAAKTYAASAHWLILVDDDSHVRPEPLLKR